MTRPVQVSPSVWFRLFTLVPLLTAFTFSALLAAQDTQPQQGIPAAGTYVSVKMLDAIDSNSGASGQQYRATVSKTVNSGGVSIAQGSPAMVTLTKNGSNWSAQLSSLTINGQSVAVTSTTASVGGGGANAQNAASAVSSVLGGFGHHSNTASQVAAAASGARVFLPPGSTLNFTLGAPPAASSAPAAKAAPASASAPAAAPASASAPSSANAPASASAPNAGSAPNSASAASAAPTSAVAPSGDSSQAQTGTYFYCFTDYSGSNSYLSDIFFYPLVRSDPHSLAAPEAASNYQDYQSLLNVAFKKYLEKNYSFKNNSNYPVTCGGDEQQAVSKMNKARMAGMAANDNKKAVETGWTNKDVVPSAYCTSGAPDTGLNYSDAFVTNGRMRAPIISAFMKFTNTKAAACYLFPNLASAKAERDRQFTIAKGYGKLNDTGWKGQ